MSNTDKEKIPETSVVNLWCTENGLPPCRGSLSLVLGKAEVPEYVEYAELDVSKLTDIAEELRKTQSPKQLSNDLIYNLIAYIGRGLTHILKAPRDTITKVVTLLKEIQAIEEGVQEDCRDPLYAPFIKIPLANFIATFEAQLQTSN
jgi:hypothetical protein